MRMFKNSIEDIRQTHALPRCPHRKVGDGCGQKITARQSRSMPWRLSRHGWTSVAALTWIAPAKAERSLLCAALLVLCLAAALAARADTAETTEVVEVAPVELLSAEALATLVAPVALYPDDLLAIVLPAATFPVQVVLAARFLDAREADPDLAPDETWDASIVALLNYPEVLALLDENLSWASELGAAVLVQEQDVIAAVGEFRRRAQTAGNLKSDDKQTVAVREDKTIEITPVQREVIYVPYYDPHDVTSYQARRVYHYYPRAYPVYYYPYPSSHFFANGPFWGVTSAFSIGWHSRSLHWHHHGFHDHPYFGYTYYDPFYYRRPHIWLNVNFRDRLRRHDGRHHADNRWHGGDGRRNHRRDRHARREGLPNRRHRNRDRDDRPRDRAGRSPNTNPIDAPRDRGRIETPGNPNAQGIKRALAMPNKHNHRRPPNENKPTNRPFVHKPTVPASARTTMPSRTMSTTNGARPGSAAARSGARLQSAASRSTSTGTRARATQTNQAAPRAKRNMQAARVKKPEQHRMADNKPSPAPSIFRKPNDRRYESPKPSTGPAIAQRIKRPQSISQRPGRPSSTPQRATHYRSNAQRPAREARSLQRSQRKPANFQQPAGNRVQTTRPRPNQARSAASPRIQMSTPTRSIKPETKSSVRRKSAAFADSRTQVSQSRKQSKAKVNQQRQSTRSIRGPDQRATRPRR